MSEFLYCIIAFFSLVGLIYVIDFFTYLLIGGREENMRLVILLHSDDAEFVIRDALLRIKSSNSKINRVYALDCGMDENTHECAVKLLNDYNIPLYTKDTIGEQLFKGM